jgi:hypothetical protein
MPKGISPVATKGSIGALYLISTILAMLGNFLVDVSP